MMEIDSKRSLSKSNIGSRQVGVYKGGCNTPQFERLAYRTYDACRSLKLSYSWLRNPNCWKWQNFFCRVLSETIDFDTVLLILFRMAPYWSRLLPTAYATYPSCELKWHDAGKGGAVHVVITIHRQRTASSNRFFMGSKTNHIGGMPVLVAFSAGKYTHSLI
ncbi:hypothetical protein AB1N83_002106 [Pleurotus pulmonarius]